MAWSIAWQTSTGGWDGPLTVSPHSVSLGDPVSAGQIVVVTLVFTSLDGGTIPSISVTCDGASGGAPVADAAASQTLWNGGNVGWVWSGWWTVDTPQADVGLTITWDDGESALAYAYLVTALDVDSAVSSSSVAANDDGAIPPAPSATLSPAPTPTGPNAYMQAVAFASADDTFAWPATATLSPSVGAPARYELAADSGNEPFASYASYSALFVAGEAAGESSVTFSADPGVSGTWALSGILLADILAVTGARGGSSSLPNWITAHHVV